MTEESNLRISVDSRGARQNVRALNRELSDLDGLGLAASDSASLLGRTLSTVGIAAAGFGASLGLGRLTSDLSELQGINTRIATLTGDLASSQSFLARSSQELSTSYVTLADGYASLLPLYASGVLSLDRTQVLTTGLAEAAQAVGAGSAQVGQAIFGMSQALSSGVVNMEDFRQVTDPLPGLMNNIANAMGITIAELRELIGSAQLTSREFGDVLPRAFAAYAGAAEAASGNITQTFERARNEYLFALAAFEEPISNVAVGSGEALADAFALVGENAEEIESVITAVGAAAAVAIGGQALGAAGRYAQSLALVASRAVTLNAVQRNSLGTTAQTQIAALAQAQATERATAAALAEAQVRARSLPAAQREAFVRGELTVAANAQAAAAARLLAAEQAAIASTRRLTLAQRLNAASSVAMAGAQRALAGSLALVGGPAGAALLAVGGLAFLLTRQSDAEKSSIALKKAVDELNDSYFNNADAARNAGEAQLRAAEDTLAAFRAEIDAVQSRLSINVFTDFFDNRSVEEAQEGIRGVYDEIDQINELIQSQVSLANSVSPYDAQAIADAADAFDLVGARAEVARGILETLVPNDAKRLQLEEYSRALDEALQINAISPEEYQRATAAIQEQLDKLNGVADAAKAARSAADELQQALFAALPEERRAAEFAEQYEILETAFERGGDQAGLYMQAMIALRNEFDQEGAEIAADKIRELNEALADRTATPFAQYADEIELLNRAIAELPDEAGNLAGNLQRAFANLDFEIQADLTTVSGDGLDGLARDYTARRDALELFIEERGRTEEQAELDRVALAQSYGDQVIAVNEDIQRRLIELSGGNIAASFDLDVQSDTTELENLFRDRQITQAEYEATREAQAITHQEQLNEIVRSGEGTRAQIEAAGFQARFAGILERYSAEIGLAQEAATTLFDIRLGRETRQADAARVDADAAQAIYEDALSNFQRNGSEENRIALETAQQRRDIAQSEARKQFEDQKDAAVASARLAGGVAFLNALATPPWYVGVGLAAVALATTREKVAEIKSTQFGSGTGSSVGVSGGGSVGAGGSASIAGPTGVTNTPLVQDRTILIVAGNFRNDQEAMEEVARAERDARTQGLIFNNSDGTPNFQNVPERVVRLT